MDLFYDFLSVTVTCEPTPRVRRCDQSETALHRLGGLNNVLCVKMDRFEENVCEPEILPRGFREIVCVK